MEKQPSTEQRGSIWPIVVASCALFIAVLAFVTMAYLFWTTERPQVVVNNDVNSCCCRVKEEGGVKPSSFIYKMQNDYHTISPAPFTFEPVVPNYWPVLPLVYVEPYPFIQQWERFHETQLEQSVYVPSVVVLDNIFVGGSALSAVPEPQSWAMMITGFALVGLLVRRHNDKQTA